ncbi:MAG: DUF4129 domain-containing protein [Brevinematales bacterium]|nr:DUF4129 domain-containing protein [Brevinematales bacterium]
MGQMVWMILLCGLTITIGGSLFSLVIAHPENLMPFFWIGCASQSLVIGMRMYSPLRWTTLTRILLAYPFSLAMTWLAGLLLPFGQLPLSSLGGLLGFSWFLGVLFWWGFSQKPRLFFHLLNKYPQESSLPYEKWAAEEIARLNLNTSLDSIEKLFFWTLFFSLLLSGLATLVHPSLQGHLTIGWVLLFLGFWGSRSVLHEQFQLFGWRMQGLSTDHAKPTIPHGLLVLLLVGCLGISFLLPHRFVLVSLESLGVKFRESVKQTEIELQHQNEEESIPSLTEEHQTQESPPLSSPSPLLIWGARGAGLFLFLYVVIGLIGYFFERFWSYKPKNALIRWLIRFYEKNKVFFQIVGFVLSLFWTVISTLTGISLLQKALSKRKENLKENEVLKEQLYALFEHAENTSDEKKEEIMTIVRYFVRLIEAASTRILPYRSSYGPLEYIEKLSQNLSSLRESLLWIVSVFNESRYSLHLLSQEKKNTFAQTVETVITEINK